jgi:hypothetical protein
MRVHAKAWQSARGSILIGRRQQETFGNRSSWFDGGPVSGQPVPCHL